MGVSSMNLNDLRKKRNEILALAEKHGAATCAYSVRWCAAKPGRIVTWIF